MEVKIWEVVDGKLVSVNVAIPERRINVLLKLRKPVEIDQMESILSNIENFYGIVGEVSPLRPARKERRPRARRIAFGLEDFEKEIKEEFGSQEFRGKEAIQHYVDKGLTESLTLKRKIWNFLRQLTSLGRLKKIKTGVWQFAE